MPNMKELTPKAARDVLAEIIEEKVDGTCMEFNGQDLISERGIIRNDRFPNILKDLRRLDWQVQGEIAIPGGHVLDVNQKINWPKAKFHIFKINSSLGSDVSGESPAENRRMLEKIVIPKRFWRLWLPRRFKSFDEGWQFVKDRKKAGKYSEGVVTKDAFGREFKTKLYTEVKVPILRHEPGKVKGRFIVDLNGVECGVSGTSVGYIDIYSTLLAGGVTPIAEIEYLFLTDNKIMFQPKLRNIGTMQGSTFVAST